MKRSDFLLALLLFALAVGLGLYLRWQQEQRAADDSALVCGNVSAGLTSWNDLPIVEVASAPNSPSLGSADALVVVEIWGDYACPYTRLWLRETFRQLRVYFNEEYVRFVWRDMPLDFHPGAMMMAQLARCTGERYWSFVHDIPLIDVDPNVDARLIALTLRVNPDECLADPAILEAIAYDQQAAQAAGLQAATPTFVINGRVLQGAVNAPTFAELIIEAMNSR